MILFFVRHGESEANVLRVFSNRGLKHPLTQMGREQTALLAERLAGENVLAFYSSPLLRAAQSAEIMSRRLGIPYEVTPALAEYDMGVYEGTSDEEGWKADGALLGRWYEGDWDARHEGGESFNDMLARFVPFLEMVKEKYRREDGTVVLVGHGSLYKCMLPQVLTKVSFLFTLQHIIGNTSFALAELRGSELVCVQWGDETIE